MSVLKSFKYIETLVRNLPKKTVAVACANDEHTLEAVIKAADKGLIDYKLIGDKPVMMKIAKSMGHEIDERKIYSSTGEEDAAVMAVEMFKSGEADFIQKGLMQTSTILKEVVNKKTGIGNERLMSNVALLEIPKYHKLVGITDGGMIMYPDYEQKVEVLQNAIDMFHLLGYDNPKVAAICALEVVNPKMPETVDASKLKEVAERGVFGKCVFEGPISTDLAFSKEAATIKSYESPVAGDVDVALVPSIYAGNLMVKGLLLFAEAKMAGVVVGAKCPIALNSRSATFEEKFYALMVCSLMCEKIRNK